MPRISYFSTPDLARLPKTARRVLERRAARLGFYPNFFLTFAIRPHHLARWAAHYDALMLGRSALSVLDRELIALVVSRVNGCAYCLTTHGARLRLLSGRAAWADRVARDFRRAGLDGRTRAMLEFAVKLTRRPGAVSAGDLARLRRHGFSEEACWDVLETAAMFNFTNRIATGSGMRPNPQYARMGRGGASKASRA
jgi:uncharacterized peroxidase-related enzyme